MRAGHRRSFTSAIGILSLLVYILAAANHITAGFIAPQFAVANTSSLSLRPTV